MKEIEKYEGPKELHIQTYTHKTQYYETDQMGIIHHSNYIKWMEEARLDLMEQLQFPYARMEEMEIMSPVISLNCEYKSMVRYPETVEIIAKISYYDGVKMTIQYKMVDEETGELRAMAESRHCFLNRTGKPISLKRSYPEISTRFFQLYDEDGNVMEE